MRVETETVLGPEDLEAVLTQQAGPQPSTSHAIVPLRNSISVLFTAVFILFYYSLEVEVN